MNQLINLYQPVFRQQSKMLSATTLMTIVAIAMALMFALYSTAHSTMKGLQRTSADLTLNYSLLNSQLSAATSKAASSGNVSISDEITLLQSQIEDRKALLKRIDSLFIDANDDFGEVFETLAQTNLPGLWLTGIQLDQDGSIEITGTTLDPKLVPRYLQLITQQPLLASLNSGTVNIIREESDHAEISFVLNYNTYGQQQ